MTQSSMTTTTMGALGTESGISLDRASLWLLLAFIGSLQISIALAGILVTLTLLCWAVLLVRDRAWPTAPSFMVPLLAYAAVTLVSAAFSIDPVPASLTASSSCCC